MPNKFQLPPNIETHLKSLGKKIGPEAEGDLKATLSELLASVNAAAEKNSDKAFSPFIARPSGYVD